MFGLPVGDVKLVRVHDIYLEYHSVCPLLSVSPLVPKGGHTHLRFKEWGGPNSDGWRESLALCSLCGPARCFFFCALILLARAGAYLGFCQGGCTFLADLPPSPSRIWIWIRIKILSWIRIRIKTMRIHSPGLNCQKICLCGGIFRLFGGGVPDRRLLA
jgi:hypothetical protein